MAYIKAFIHNNGAPALSLTDVKIDIYDIDANTKVVNQGAMIELVSSGQGGGWYRYDFTSYDPAKNYSSTASSATTGTYSVGEVFSSPAVIGELIAIKTKTSNIPASPASTTDVTNATSPLATSAALTTVGNNVTAIAAKTGNLPASPASTGDVTSATSSLATSAALTTVGNNVIAIKAKTDAEPNYVTGAVLNATHTTSSFTTDLAQASNDWWKDCFVVFTSGNLVNQAKRVTGYNGTTKAITVDKPFTAAPTYPSSFSIVNH